MIFKSLVLSMMLVVSQASDKLSKDEILLDFVKVDMPNSINNVYTTKVVDAWLKDIANKPVTITDRSTGEIKVIGKALCGFKDKVGYTKVRILTYQEFTNDSKYVLRPYCLIKKSSVSDACNLIIEDAELRELMILPRITASRFDPK